jgi:6-phosphogluconolactonase
VIIEFLPTPAAVATDAARWLTAAVRDAVGQRGRCTLALSGGSTPGATLRALAQEDIPWRAVHLFQVDERIAPAGHPDRNWTHLEADLLSRIPLPPTHAHPMPVEDPDPEAAAQHYTRTLATHVGTPAIFDVVQLGLGADGHTASLAPAAPALELIDRDVAPTAPFAGYRRLTLTLPALNRARTRLWLVTGAAKAPMLERLLRADPTIPAGRVSALDATLITDTETTPQRP